MKWLLVAFIYSCYNAQELEIIYEGENDYIAYSYDNHECGINVYSVDSSEDVDYNDERKVEVVEPPQWTPPFLRFW